MDRWLVKGLKNAGKCDHKQRMPLFVKQNLIVDEALLLEIRVALDIRDEKIPFDLLGAKIQNDIKPGQKYFGRERFKDPGSRERIQMKHVSASVICGLTR